MAFLDGQPRWRGARIAYLQGDASTRSYARLSGRTARALLMDAPRQPDGPPIRDGLPYSRIAHLAEDMCARSWPSARSLRQAGLSAPEMLAEDLDAGLMLVEDLGDRVFSAEIAARTRVQDELWRAAVDVLVKLRGVPVPRKLPLPDGTGYPLPRRDRGAFQIEVELLLDWYWPALYGEPVPQRSAPSSWRCGRRCSTACSALPGGCLLRDYPFAEPDLAAGARGACQRRHHRFPGRAARAAGYDLASLLQDARVDVPEELEARLLAHYCARGEGRADASTPRRSRRLCRFRCTAKYQDPRHFRAVVKRDGKAQYLAHIPRIWRYLQRNLRDAAARCAGGVVRPALPGRRARAGKAAGMRRKGGDRGMGRRRWTTAMVLSAGLGTRMAPAANGTSKAAGAAARQGADRSRARSAGGGGRGARRRQRAPHGRSDRAAPQGRRAPVIEISDERAARLDTGGGVRKALPRLGAGPS